MGSFLNSEEVPGGIKGARTLLCIAATCTLRLCFITLMVIQLWGLRRIGRRWGRETKEELFACWRGERQGQCFLCYFTITCFCFVERHGAYGSTLGHPVKCLTNNEANRGAAKRCHLRIGEESDRFQACKCNQEVVQLMPVLFSFVFVCCITVEDVQKNPVDVFL